MRAFVLVMLLLGAGVEKELDYRAVDEALTIANSSLESTHRQYHAGYRIPVNSAPVDFVSVVSPFRRLVLLAETQQRLGRRMFGQREALAALQPDPDRFEVYVELTFHPHNTFVGVPAYTIELQPLSFRGPVVMPRNVDRLPRFGPRLDDGSSYPFPYPYPYTAAPASGGQPLAGGTLVARLTMDQLEPRGIYRVVVKDREKELAGVRLDLARVR